MINFISITGDWNYNLYIAFSALSFLLLFLVLGLFIFGLLVATKIKGKRLSFLEFVSSSLAAPWVFCLVISLGAYSATIYYGLKEIGSDKWVMLAQAESTILQLQVSSEIQKKPLPFDRQKSDDWIKELRDKVNSGKINYGQFKTLVQHYNALNIGSDDIKNWFKTNSSDSIRKEIMSNVEGSMNNPQQYAPQGVPETQPQKVPEQPDIEHQLNSALD